MEVQPSHENHVLGGDHEEVHFLSDPASGLRAIIALHDTSRGPALGGVRCREYACEADAVADVLRLSRSMTMKTIMADIPAGGGKAVILEPPADRREVVFQEFGRRVQQLQGRFFTSADFGTTEADLRQVRKTTRFVTDPDQEGLQELAEKTAEGVFVAAGTCLDVLGIAEWSRIRVAIQGLGKIGLRLATMAARAGAEVFASEIRTERIGKAVDTLPLKLVDPDEIYSVACDIFSPCAHGGILTPETVAKLQCRLVVGAANNQLQDDVCGDLLAERSILYAPDFVVNAGAVLVGCRPALPGFSPEPNMASIARKVREIFVESMETEVPPHRVAMAKAEKIWKEQRARRSAPTSP